MMKGLLWFPIPALPALPTTDPWESLKPGWYRIASPKLRIRESTLPGDIFHTGLTGFGRVVCLSFPCGMSDYADRNKDAQYKLIYHGWTVPERDFHRFMRKCEHLGKDVPEAILKRYSIINEPVQEALF